MTRKTKGCLISIFILLGICVVSGVIGEKCDKEENEMEVYKSEAKDNKIETEPEETSEPSSTPETKKKSYNEDEITVYITKTGSKYHRAGCQYLRQSCIPITLAQAKARGYTPCKVCKPPK